jgi:predicted proteasome-type protease
MEIGNTIKLKDLINGFIFYKSIDKYWLINNKGNFISDFKETAFVQFEENFKASKCLLIEKNIFKIAEEKENNITCLKSELFCDLLSKLNLRK